MALKVDVELNVEGSLHCRLSSHAMCFVVENQLLIYWQGFVPKFMPNAGQSLANATDNMAWRTIPEANGDHFSFNTPTDMSSIGSCRSVVVVG